MRYDKPIYFQRFVQGSYNENTGNYEDDSPVEEMVMASVMDTRTETMMQVYGQSDKVALLVIYRTSIKSHLIIFESVQRNTK